jgi:hypothetical protein
MSSDRLIRWRLLLEEYGPRYEHIGGTKNVVADALSRLTCLEHAEVPTPDNLMAMATCFVAANDHASEDFPLSPALIAKYQREDVALQEAVRREGGKAYTVREVEDVDVMTYHNKIIVPAPLQERIIA